MGATTPSTTIAGTVTVLMLDTVTILIMIILYYPQDSCIQDIQKQPQHPSFTSNTFVNQVASTSTEAPEERVGVKPEEAARVSHTTLDGARKVCNWNTC